MKPEEILEKTLNGELAGDALTAEVGKLSVEDQANLTKLSNESAAESLGKATGLRKERDRVQTQLTDAEKAAEDAATKAAEDAAAEAAAEAGDDKAKPPAKDETMSQFRNEQKDKAISRFNEQFKDLSDDQRKAVIEHFDKIDSGKVDADNIYNEIVGAYAFVDKDNLLAAQGEKSQREAEAAAEAAADAARSGGAPNNGGEPPKFSQAVQDLAKRANITNEAAEKVSTQGTRRVHQ